MKDEIWQKRQFILSSFTRLKILINNDVYRFADQLINQKWDHSSLNLDEVDKFIKSEYDKFRSASF